MKEIAGVTILCSMRLLTSLYIFYSVKSHQTWKIWVSGSLPMSFNIISNVSTDFCSIRLASQSVVSTLSHVHKGGLSRTRNPGGRNAEWSAPPIPRYFFDTTGTLAYSMGKKKKTPTDAYFLYDRFDILVSSSWGINIAQYILRNARCRWWWRI